VTVRLDVGRACAEDLAAEVHAQADVAVAERGRFVIALAGGTTPTPLYRAVEAHAEQRERDGAPVSWDRWAALLTDERCLPAGHPDRNDGMIAMALPVLADAGRLRTIPAELDPDAAAADYAHTVADGGPIDLAILGLGADGHTAGVFRPSDDDDPNGPACVAVHDAPGPFPRRITLTLATLATARQVWFVVDGADRTKDVAVARLTRGEGLAVLAAGRERTRLILLQPATSRALRR
jgi:6-phosphogluconolactonase